MTRRAAIHPSQRRLVLDAVRELLHRAEATTPPIDVCRLARLQGVVGFREEPLGGADAQLSPTPHGFVITLNSHRTHSQRRRFSIAHEVAHTFFHPQTDAFRNGAVRLTSSKHQIRNLLEERLCDEAAREMLMPNDQFSAAAADASPSIELIQRLAQLFDTSLEATALRYGFLGSYPVQVSVFKPFRGLMRRKWSKGPAVYKVPSFQLAAPADHTQAGIARAFESDDRVEGRELSNEEYPPRWIGVEASGFGGGRSRYVLALITSGYRVNE